MENNSQDKIGGMPNKIWIIIGVLLVVAVIVVAATTSKKTGPAQPSDQPTKPATTGETPITPGEVVEEGTFSLEGAVIEASGSNPILEGKVVTLQGEVVKSDLPPLAPGAPQQSNPVNQADLSANVIKVNVSAAGFEPSEFTVRADSPVSISFTTTDSQSHVFKFDDPALSAVAVGIGPGETRLISFNSPTSPGEYSFRCDIPGHARRGEVGKMIVQ